MIVRKLSVLIAVGVCLQLLPAYELFFVGNQNEDFNSSLSGWYVADPGFDFPHSTGTAEWSSDHGGSAHMSISGAPGNIELITTIGTTIYPGDTLLMMISKTNTEGFGEFDLGIGHNSPFSQIVKAPGPAGDYEVRLVSTNFYLPGTIFGVWSAVWPGSAEAWIQYVRLLPADSMHVAARERGRSLLSVRPSMAVRAYPSPTTGSISLAFDLAEKTSAEVGIYDLSGSLVRRLKTNGTVGTNRVVWNGADELGRDVAAGVYCFSVRAEGASVASGKITLTH